MALPLQTPGAPELEPLGLWEEMIADYRSTGMTLGEHPLALMRAGLDPELLRSSDLESVDDGTIVEVGGMVVARQRPETAGGVVFVLLEDECGTVNLIVPPKVYERHRAEVRTSPLIRAKGRLERREGTTNILVSEVAELHAGGRGSNHGDREASGQSAAARNARVGARERTDQLQSVAPAGNNFGRGHRG